MNEKRHGYKRVAILNLGWGNLEALRAFVLRCNFKAVILNYDDFLAADAIYDCVVIPGIGGGQPVRELGLEAMGELKGKLLSQPLVVGICLGMQVLCGWLEEAATNGFGIVNTPIRKISLKSNISKANIGYRTIATDDGPMRFYFCHSFAAERVETLNEVDTCFTFEEPCFEKYIAGFRAGKIYGLQFHPEKSGPAGREFFIRIMNV